MSRRGLARPCAGVTATQRRDGRGPALGPGADLGERHGGLGQRAHRDRGRDQCGLPPRAGVGASAGPSRGPGGGSGLCPVGGLWSRPGPRRGGGSGSGRRTQRRITPRATKASRVTSRWPSGAASRVGRALRQRLRRCAAAAPDASVRCPTLDTHTRTHAPLCLPGMLCFLLRGGAGDPRCRCVRGEGARVHACWMWVFSLSHWGGTLRRWCERPRDLAPGSWGSQETLMGVGWGGEAYEREREVLGV